MKTCSDWILDDKNGYWFAYDVLTDFRLAAYGAKVVLLIEAFEKIYSVNGTRKDASSKSGFFIYSTPLNAKVKYDYTKSDEEAKTKAEEHLHNIGYRFVSKSMLLLK